MAKRAVWLWWGLGCTLLLASAVGASGWLLLRPLEPVRRIPIPVAGYLDVTPSSDGRLALVQARREDDTEEYGWHALVVMDLSTGRELARLEGVEQYAGLVADGRELVGVWENGALCAWDTASWELRRVTRVAPPGAAVRSAFLSRDGRRLVIAYLSQAPGLPAEVWDYREDRRLYTLPPDCLPVRLSADGRYLVATLTQPRGEGRRLHSEMVLELRDDGPREVSFQGGEVGTWSPILSLPESGRLMDSMDDRLRFWDPATGALVEEVRTPIAGLVADVSPGGEYGLAFVGNGMGVLDLTTGQMLEGLEASFTGWFVSPAQFYLVGETEISEWQLPPRWLLRLRGGVYRGLRPLRDWLRGPEEGCCSRVPVEKAA